MALASGDCLRLKAENKESETWHIFYFKLDIVYTNKYLTEYQRDVLPLRNSILRALLKNTGAAGLRLKPFAMDVISEFYFSGSLPAGWRKRDDVAFIGGRTVLYCQT